MTTDSTLSTCTQAQEVASMRISMVRHAHDTECITVDVDQIVDAIREGDYRAEVAAVREAYATGGKAAAAVPKKRLPAFMASGTFFRRAAEALEGHSGLICADLDDLGERLDEIRGRIISDPYTYCAFRSPTGTGLKVIYRCDPARPHSDAFRAAAAHVRTRHGCEIDRACSDVSRLCYVSHDPDIYYHPDVPPLPYAEATPAAAPVAQAAPARSRSLTPPGTPTLDEIREVLSHIPPRPDYSTWLRIASAVWDVTSLEDGCRLLAEWSPEETPGEYTTKHRHRLTQVHYATLVHMAREHGYRPQRRASVRVASAGAETQALGADDEPLMILPSEDVPIIASARRIFARIAEERDLFFRGGRVFEVLADGDGTRRLSPISSTEFRSRLESYGRVCVHRSTSDGERVVRSAICPDETARALLASRPARDLLPAINRMVSCPVLVDDGGTLRVLGPGWHPHCGGILITGGETPPRVPLPEAVDALAALVHDFDFASAGDRSRALASYIAPALRFGGWLAGHLPIDLGEADASQSGKTYRQKCVAAVYRERPNTVVQRDGGVGGIDESISQKLIDGRPFILFDNLRGRLDSAYLEAVLTAPGSMPARVPHRGEVQVDATGFIFQLTSNGVETTRDLANRSSIVRIRKRPPGYAWRQYPEGDVYQHIVARQPYYLGCVLSIVAEWIAQGQPRTRETRHSFREWGQIMDWIVQHILQAAPLLDGYDEARERISDPRRNWLRSLCIALRDAGRLGEYGAAQLAEFAIENEITPPNSKPDADESVIARAIGKVMASTFAGGDCIDIDGFRIARAKHYSPTAEKEIWGYSIGEERRAA